MKTQTFRDRVLEIVRRIPRGKFMTYKDVARMAGSPGAYRAVGSIMKHNYDTTIPCHRVVRSDGTVGQYNRGGETQKTLLLQKEGAL